MAKLIEINDSVHIQNNEIYPPEDICGLELKFQEPVHPYSIAKFVANVCNQYFRVLGLEANYSSEDVSSDRSFLTTFLIYSRDYSYSKYENSFFLPCLHLFSSRSIFPSNYGAYNIDSNSFLLQINPSLEHHYALKDDDLKPYFQSYIGKELSEVISVLTK